MTIQEKVDSYQSYKQYHDADLISAFKPTSNDGATFTNRVYPGSKEEYEFSECGEVLGRPALFIYVVPQKEVEECEGDLGGVDWDSAASGIQFVD